MNPGTRDPLTTYEYGTGQHNEAIASKVPGTVEPIPTLGAPFPRGRPVQDPFFTILVER